MMARAASGVLATLVNSCVVSHSTPIFRSVVVGASDKSLVQLPTRVSPHCDACNAPFHALALAKHVEIVIPLLRQPALAASKGPGRFKILSPVLAQPLPLEFKLNAVLHLKGIVSITRGTKSKQGVWRQREIRASIQRVEVFDI
jgi:hypothetical protein